MKPSVKTLGETHLPYVQSDEIWCFVGKKRRNLRDSDPAELGDQWVFVAMDADSKLVPSFVIGKRTRETTLRFLRDLQSRLTDARFQLTTDGFHFYERGVEDVFGGTVDFAQLVKLFGTTASTGMKDTPHQESRRLYPKCATDGPIPHTSAQVTSNART